MNNMRFALCAFLCATLAVGCASVATPGATMGPSAVPTALASPTAAIPTQGPESEVLPAGTHRVERGAVADDATFPPILIALPDGWYGDGRFVSLVRPGEEIPVAAVGFWEVDQVYGNPCPSSGTLFQPGPTVDDLVAALADIPLRNPTRPIDVTIDGYAGKYLEWSVPADIDFAACDPDGVKDDYFDSWTDTDGGGRYQQGPGQVDRLWILDIDGARLVIDAFWMPLATSDEREQLQRVVESIRFER